MRPEAGRDQIMQPSKSCKRFWSCEHPSTTLLCCPFLLIHHVRKISLGNSPAVQWLRLCTFTAKGKSSIPGQGNKTLQAAWCGQKQNKTKQKHYKKRKIALSLFPLSLYVCMVLPSICNTCVASKVWLLVCTHTHTHTHIHVHNGILLSHKKE